MQGKTKRVVQKLSTKPTQKCTQLNGIDPVHVTKCVIIIRLVYCVPHVLYVSVVHKNMPYDGVQVYIRNNSSVCTSASPGTGVIQVGFRPDNSSLVQGIALPGQNDPDILGSKQVVNNPGTGSK